MQAERNNTPNKSQAMVHFQCLDCSRDFSRRAHLRNHLKTHEKEKIEQGLAQLQTEQDNIDMLVMLEESSNDEITCNVMQQLEECLDISEEDHAKMINNESNNSNSEQESNNEVSFLFIYFISIKSNK